MLGGDRTISEFTAKLAINLGSAFRVEAHKFALSRPQSHPAADEREIPRLHATSCPDSRPLGNST